jgi:hypothetical protein
MHAAHLRGESCIHSAGVDGCFSTFKYNVACDAGTLHCPNEICEVAPPFLPAGQVYEAYKQDDRGRPGAAPDGGDNVVHPAGAREGGGCNNNFRANREV